jgi:hypothetical protein
MYSRQSHPVTVTTQGDEAGILAEQTQEWFIKHLQIARDRKERYRIFDEMDTFGLVSGILDVYAEESTQKDYDRQRSVWIESKSQGMITAGDECLRNVQMEDHVSFIARREAKRGDAFQRMIYQNGKGVLGWKLAHADKVHRLEDKFGRLIGFREDGQTYRQKKRKVSWPWDYIHFRLLGKYEEAGYGTALLDSMFRPWRQMTLAEDSVLMYRMRRAPDRNLILVDVGNMEEHEAVQYLNAWRKRFRKFEFIDPASPNYKKQYNPLTPLEDVFVAMRRDNTTRIESLSGSGNMGELYDLDHFRNKFFGAAKVPKAYFGFEGEINAKATLIQQDVRFARTAKRLQRSVMYGIRQLLEMHYILLAQDANTWNFDFNKPDKAFLVQMSPISYLDEWERLELVELRYRIVEAMSRLATDLQLDPRVWAIYILLNYAKLPEDLVMKLISKTPDEPITTQGAGGGGFGGFESFPARLKGALQSVDPDQRSVILENMSPVGMYPLAPKEKVAIARAMHQSPELRKVVGDIAYYHEDEGEDAADHRVLRESLQQVDPAILPPMTGGVALADDYEDDPEAKQLKEDMETIKAGKELKELPKSTQGGKKNDKKEEGKA